MPITTHATPRLFAELGYLLSTRGAWSQACLMLDALEELDPDSSSVDVLRGGLEIGRRRFERAELSYRRALEKEPASELARACLAEALLLQRRFREGEKLLGQVLRSGADEAATGLAKALERGIRDGEFR